MSIALPVGLSNQAVISKIEEIVSSNRGSPDVFWVQLRREVLEKYQLPFELHRWLYRLAFGAMRERGLFTAIWTPSKESIEQSNIGSLMKELNKASYAELYDWSIKNKEEFWTKIIEKINVKFTVQPSRVGDCSEVENPQWLPGAKLNIVDSCFQAAKDKIAIVQGDESGQFKSVSYGELESLVNRVANGLVNAGFVKGDAIGINMPLCVESIAAYLGIIKAGMAVVSIADSNTVPEIAMRLKLGKAKAVFTVDYFMRSGKKIELYSKVVQANCPRAFVLCSDANAGSLRENDVSWNNFLSVKTEFTSVQCNANDCINVLFSSGTTSEPKAIPWTHSTPIKSAGDAWLYTDLKQSDVIAWPTSLGWMMGPWLVFSGLINKSTIAVFIGSPVSKEFISFLNNANVTILGTIPTIVRGWKKNDVRPGDLPNIKLFASTGECSNFEDYLYLMSLADYKPVIEYLGGTEIGGAYMVGTPVQPSMPSTFSTPTMGIEVLLYEDGKFGNHGEGFIVGPSIGFSNVLLNKDHHSVYFQDCPVGPNGEKLRRHGDGYKKLNNGYFESLGRVDDTFKLAGIKTGSIPIERVLATHPAVSKVVAIGKPPAEGGPNELHVYVSTHNVVDETVLKTELEKLLKTNLDPVFKIHSLKIVDENEIATTASAKTIRRAYK